MKTFDNNAQNMNEFKNYITIHKNMDIGTFKPFVKSAEKRFLLKLGVTQSLMNLVKQIENNVIAGNTPTPLEKELLELTQSTVSWYALYKFLPDNVFNVADAGNGLEYTQAPSDKQFNTKLYATLRTAYDELESLTFQFLLENHASFTDFDTTEVTELFICNPAVLLKYQSSIREEGSLELWLKIRTEMRFVEQNYIKPLLCIPTFDYLKTEMRNHLLGNSSMNAKDTELLNLVRAVAVEYSLERALPKLNSAFTPAGTKKTYRENAEASYTDLSDVIDQYDKNVKHSVKVLLKYLDENKDIYTDWADCQNKKIEQKNCENLPQKTAKKLTKNYSGAVAIL